jgi:hypothetical protein
MAQQFYRKPTALGGGGNTFTGWAVPASLSQTANMSAAVTATVSDHSVTLVGVGTETGTDNSTKTKVTIVVSPTGITTTINN